MDSRRTTDVDTGRWVGRHLSEALEAERIDEKDFHVSKALELLRAREG